MKMLTKAIERKLRQNHNLASVYPGRDNDFEPVVKFFAPWGSATWLISEMDENGRMFGLCDLGEGYPELGYVMLQDLEEVRGPMGLRIEREIHWKAEKPLSEYADEARNNGRICA